jgi:hypothetical protein
VFARRPIYSRNGHYVIDGLDGLGDMPISFGISVIANELIGQTKVDKSIKSIDDVMTVAAVYGSPCEHELLI